jgi:hypothetical protein
MERIDPLDLNITQFPEWEWDLRVI